MNIVILSGNLVKDFTLNKDVARSSIAVSKKDGNDFIELVAFKQTAEICAKIGRKGTPVLIQGTWNVYKANDKIYQNCLVNSIQVFTRKSVNDQPQTNNTEQLEDEEEIDIADDDLPF